MCESWCVTKLCVKGSVKVVGVQSWCVTKLCVKDGVCKMVVVCVTGGRAGGGPGGRSTRDTESKTRTPHNVVGKNDLFLEKQVFGKRIGIKCSRALSIFGVYFILR